MKRLKHQHIVELKEVLGSNSKIFLVLEFIEGGEFTQVIRKGKKIDEK